MAFNLVDLSVGRGGSKQRAALIYQKRLHLQFLRLENYRRLAIRHDLVNARRGAGGGKNCPRAVGRDGPDVSGWAGVQRLERRRQFQTTGTADRHSVRSAFHQFVEFGLFPGARTFAECGAGEYLKYEQDCEQSSRTNSQFQIPQSRVFPKEEFRVTRGESRFKILAGRNPLHFLADFLVSSR